MPRPYSIPPWKSAPFVRLLLPFIVGILCGWYLQIPLSLTIGCLTLATIAFFLFYFLKLATRFRYQYTQGILLNIILFCLALIFTNKADIRNDKNWFGHFYSDSSVLVVRIAEPLVGKEKSYKAEAVAEEISHAGKMKRIRGRILLYFSKDSSLKIPAYGDRIVIRGGLQRIKNSGNPGTFDYERYMCFQQTFHQAFLKDGDFTGLKTRKINPVYRFVFFARDRLIKMLRSNIRGNKKVTGITEALLIGYKDDLDKEVVEAYSNTGVVHIIAISGMHLGLIYVVLVWVFSKLPYIKKTPVLRVILILSCLWLFSLITGASASVIRSAVMFTCIITGKTFFKQADIYNSLAASAFLLLCYDPFLLWDVGFQLSYLAVVGIVWLQRPIFNSFYTKHRPLQKLWELCAITLAAQVLTLPVCIYYFHQVPTTFLFTNLICVPLSTIILFAEIAVIIFSVVPFAGLMIGKFAYLLTWLMNAIIQFFSTLPFSLVDNISISPLSTWLLYCSVCALCSGLLHRKKTLLRLSPVFLLGAISLWSYEKVVSLKQKKIVIYHLNRQTAVDFIAGNKYVSYCSDKNIKASSAQNYTLKPARISLQVIEKQSSLPQLTQRGNIRQFCNKTILIIDSATVYAALSEKVTVDILLICGNPKLVLKNICDAVSPAVVVFDGSNSLWKIGQWKKECEELHLRCRVTAEEGAFILDASKP